MNFISPRTVSTPIAPGALLSLTPEPATSKPVGPHTPKILIADDNVIILKTVAIALKSAGYEVRTAMDGSAAISCVRRERPDLIILDINFPPEATHSGGIQWDGFLILDWLRRLEESRDTPIIFITSGESTSLLEKAVSAGAVAFFHKPIDQEEMLNVIRHALGDPNDRNGSAA